VPVSTTERFVDCPAQIVAVPETVAVGAAKAVRLFVEAALHPAFVTVTPRVIGPGAVAPKLMFAVPAPEVMVPFVSVQAYVAPAPALGTDPLFAAPMQIDAGAEMTAEGVRFTVTTALPEPAPAQTVSATAVTV
jgi:hypothetical protein